MPLAAMLCALIYFNSTYITEAFAAGPTKYLLATGLIHGRRDISFYSTLKCPYCSSKQLQSQKLTVQMDRVIYCVDGVTTIMESLG